MQNMESSTTKTSPAKKNGTIKFDWENMKWQGITISQIETWRRLYPHISIMQELTEKMIRWLDSKRGTVKVRKSNWRRFIVNWLKREDEKRKFQ